MPIHQFSLSAILVRSVNYEPTDSNYDYVIIGLCLNKQVPKMHMQIHWDCLSCSDCSTLCLGCVNNAYKLYVF